MYNLIEYSDNYSDTSGSLWQFKRDEQDMNNGNPADVTTADSISFKYKSSIFANPADDECKNSCSTKIRKQLLEILEKQHLK